MAWKCVCLKDGAYFNNSRLRKGEIFYIYPREGKRDPYKGLYDDSTHHKDIVLTEADQYSKHWMMRLDEDIDEEEDQEHNDAIYARTEKIDKVVKKLAKNKMEPDADSEGNEPVVLEEATKPVTKKSTKKKSVSKSKAEPTREETENVIG